MKRELLVMKRGLSTTFFILSCLLLTNPTADAGRIAPDLEISLSSMLPGEETSVIVMLSARPDVRSIVDQNRKLHRSKIIRHLKEKADRTQRPVKAFLESRGTKGIKSLWVINGLAVKATTRVIQELAVLPEVEEIRLDKTILAPEVPFAPSTGPPEWNINAIRAPELWGLGFTGQGVVVANMDTGVDVNHPDLQDKWRAGDNSWYDPHGEHATTPFDADGHGTQTIGIMVGGNAGGTSIGVAPDAKWIAVKIFNDAGESSLSIVHQGFQWLFDPDGNPDTDDVPDVINNSWWLMGSENQCVSEFETDIQTLKAAGIAVVFSGGNSGPNPSTSISPANYPESVAVGSVDQWFQIDPQSSRGPSACGGSIFPHLVAPGVNVKVADLQLIPSPPGPPAYTYRSGTSFSAPHVSGAMALLLSALPRLRLSKLEWSLKYSSMDLGDPGADNIFGYGMIDVVKAYHLSKSPIINFDGDARADIAVYRSSNGGWYILPSAGGVPYGFGWGGDPSDKPSPGDYDGDGKTDVAVYRTRTGAWYLSPSSGAAPYGMGWGGDASDKPVPGDYDGDGKTDVAVYRTGTGAWYVIPSSGAAPYGLGWGGDPSDKPSPGDYDGDGKTDAAVYRTGTGAWYVYPSSGAAPYGFGWGGDASDKPVPGDYDGDGKTDVAVYRTGTGAWYVNPSSGLSPYGLGWGGDPSDIPVTTNYSAIY